MLFLLCCFAAPVHAAGLDARPSNTTCVAPPRPSVGGPVPLTTEPVVQISGDVPLVWLRLAAS